MTSDSWCDDDDDDDNDDDDQTVANALDQIGFWSVVMIVFRMSL